MISYVLASWSEFFQYLGLFFLSYSILKLSYKIVNNIGIFYLNWGQINFRHYGSWAVVTGGTDVIFDIFLIT